MDKFVIFLLYSVRWRRAFSMGSMYWSEKVTELLEILAERTDLPEKSEMLPEVLRSLLILLLWKEASRLNSIG